MTTTGVVEFEAHYDSPAGPGVQHEVSRFERRRGVWVYVERPDPEARRRRNPGAPARAYLPRMQQRWEDPAWVATAHGWIADRLGELGLTRTGEIEQPHVRDWATAMRVPTDAGDVWFKANTEVLAFEAGLVALLAERRPDVVPPLLAAGRRERLDADGRRRHHAPDGRARGALARRLARRAAARTPRSRSR